jgi:hypothetical protein
MLRPEPGERGGKALSAGLTDHVPYEEEEHSGAG